MITKTITFATAVFILSCSMALAQEKTQQAQILFQNVKVFNGTEDKLHDVDVLVEGNLITEVAKGAEAREGATVIDGGGRTLMPGLIDSHVHFYLSMDGGRPAMETSRWDFFPAMGAVAAREWLADGFTTVRDMETCCRTGRIPPSIATW